MDIRARAMFFRRIGDRAPLVIVPTMYYATPTQQFRDHDISLIIWANHNMRVAIQAMRDLSREIFETESLVGAEGRISSVKEVFELTGNEELAV